MSEKKLSERGKQLLHMVIDYYIKTGQPIGSSALVENYGLPWSSATVRSAMAELMDNGCLIQPHVSAGRIPAEKGIKLYVDSLLYPNELSELKRGVIRRRYKKLDGTIDEVMYETSRILSQISHCAGLATIPSTRFMKIKSAKLVKLGDKKVLVIIVFEGGMTEKTLIRLNMRIPKEVFYRMRDYLNKLAVGFTLDEVKSLLLDNVRDQERIYREFMESVIRFSTKVFERKPKSDVYIKGQTSFFDNSHFNNLEGLKELFRAFDEKKYLVDILDKVMKGDGTRVFVGSQNGVMEGYSLVAAPYGRDQRVGTLGVLGPMRMDYSQIIPLVNYTARIVTKIVSEGE
jgi:heat-inducible transcriptional repressor